MNWTAARTAGGQAWRLFAVVVIAAGLFATAAKAGDKGDDDLPLDTAGRPAWADPAIAGARM